MSLIILSDINYLIIGQKTIENKLESQSRSSTFTKLEL